MSQARLQPICRIDDLSFRYRNRREPSLSGIMLELKAGEIVLVAGPSGCGKTTLIRCINGLVPRSYPGELTGTITVNGKGVRQLTPAQLAQSVGTLLQDPEKQIVGAHVRSEVAFGPENLGLAPAEIERRVEEALDRLHIRPLADRDTFHLSGGEKQMVALAGILAMRPSLLLLDEPLASLDPMSAREALLVFRQLADEGSAILLVEHRVEDALAARPDRVLYLRNGKIAYEGATEGLAEIADWNEIKLPAEQVIRRARNLRRDEFHESQTSSAESQVAPAARGAGPSGKTEGSSKALLRFENVSFHYDRDRDVLRGIDLEIRAGERIALLGPNGSGKSTLVKQAIGLLKPSRGNVLIEGRDTRQLTVAQIARTVGYCFQSPSQMLFAPTVLEELAFGPRNLGFQVREIEESVSRSLESLNLGETKDDSPLALSFGQQKRVTIASVLAMKSRVLALDEPTAGQDFGNYIAFMDQIFGSTGETVGPHFDSVLFITHDIDLAIVYANRVILLAEGTVAADGKPEEVLRDTALLERCRLLPTTLLRENLARLSRTHRFLRAEELARFST